MFTGIVEELGAVGTLEPKDAGARMTIQCQTVISDATIGSSIAVNGVCLTAVDLSSNNFAVDLAPETLKRSNLGDLQPGSVVNLERPLLPTSRLSGHFVQGHVDATARLVSLEPLGDDNWWLKVEIPEESQKYVVEKGSICLDGISLTVAGIEGSIVSLAIIPHTYEHTTLRAYLPGAQINVEFDVLAKHIEKLMAH